MPPTAHADAKRREHIRNELNYNEWLLRESVQITERRKYDFHEKHQHANCICQHDFRPSWWQRIVGLLAWDVLPLKAGMERQQPAVRMPIGQLVDGDAAAAYKGVDDSVRLRVIAHC